MLPLIIVAGGAVLGTAAFLGLKQRCTKCESLFTLNENCLVCGKDVCGDCGKDKERVEYKDWPVSPKGRVCKDHEDAHHKTVQELKAAIDKSETVTLYSVNFKGKTPHPKFNIRIETQFHSDRDDAERELKILAATKGADAAVSANFERNTQENGNYKYSVWKGTAIV